jgi:transglutaminase-like putative cysteine protease
MRIDGLDLTTAELDGVGQHVHGDLIEIVDAQKIATGPIESDLKEYLAPSPFIESDDPEIRAAAAEAVRGVKGPRARAEALTRYVNATVQKKPTVSLPSAREVLRTKIGDCNEHTALFVAMSRAIGLPSRIAVGLAYVRGAFYYHAWAEVYLAEHADRGHWLPVDPTFNQFPADSTHLRLARGGLDKQAAIIPLIGKLKITIVDLEVLPESTPILVGGKPDALGADVSPPFRADVGDATTKEGQTSRWCLPCFFGGHQ